MDTFDRWVEEKWGDVKQGPLVPITEEEDEGEIRVKTEPTREEQQETGKEHKEEGEGLVKTEPTREEQETGKECKDEKKEERKEDEKEIRNWANIRSWGWSKYKFGWVCKEENKNEDEEKEKLIIKVEQPKDLEADRQEEEKQNETLENVFKLSGLLMFLTMAGFPLSSLTAESIGGRLECDSGPDVQNRAVFLGFTALLCFMCSAVGAIVFQRQAYHYRGADSRGRRILLLRRGDLVTHLVFAVGLIVVTCSLMDLSQIKLGLRSCGSTGSIVVNGQENS